MRRAAPLAGGCNRGFALIIVLWTLALIAFITAQLVSSGRVEVRIAGNLTANAVTEAAATGGIYQAAFQLLDPNPETRWQLDGTMHAFAIGDCRITALIEDEAGRVNPNQASPALLEALLRTTGGDAERARQLADAIGEWIGAPPTLRSEDDIAAAYQGAGLDYLPPGEPLESLDELRRVRGMTPEVFAAIRPHLSLFALTEPVLAHADPIVSAAAVTLPRAGRAGAIPAAQRFEDLIARITVTAEGPAGAEATRTAIVHVVPRSGSYAVLTWSGGGE